MTHEALYYALYYVIACYTQATNQDSVLICNLRQYGMCILLNFYMHLYVRSKIIE